MCVVVTFCLVCSVNKCTRRSKGLLGVFVHTIGGDLQSSSIFIGCSVAHHKDNTYESSSELYFLPCE